MKNPLARRHHDRALEEQRRAFFAAMSDEDLETLVAIHELKDGDTLPNWAEPIVKGIAERTVDSMGETTATEPAETEESNVVSSGFASLLAARWNSASDVTRRALETVATALGIPAPAEPRRRMRRTKYPAEAGTELSDQGTSQGEPEIAADTASESRKIEDSKPKALESKPSAGYGDEDDWEPCDSLFDALHPENRGWG